MRQCKQCHKGLSTRGTVYCNNKCQVEYQAAQKVKCLLEGKYVGKRMNFPNGNWAKNFLISHFNNTCDECGLNGEWNGRPISLEVDHKDGRAYNNSIDNLRLVCPNCHSQTNTFRNKGGRTSDRNYR